MCLSFFICNTEAYLKGPDELPVTENTLNSVWSLAGAVDMEATAPRAEVTALTVSPGGEGLGAAPPRVPGLGKVRLSTRFIKGPDE